MTSNMERILKNLSEIERYINTKSGWNSLNNKRFETIFNKIKNERLKTILNEIKKDDKESNNRNLEQRGKAPNTNVSLVELKDTEKIRFWRTEEALERLICIFNNKKCFNQFRIDDSGSKELVDLVYPNKAPHTFIELKPWNSQNSPLFGVIELLKNYYIYKDRNKIKTLIFLAPKEYFKSYENKMDIFLKFVERLNKEILKEKVELKIQYIDFIKDTFEEFVKNLSKKQFDWTESSSKSLKGKTIVDLKEHKDCLESCFKSNETLKLAFEFKDYKL